MASLQSRRLPVKPHRVSPRPTGRFGAGITPTCPGYHLNVTLQDLQWAAEHLNDDVESDYGEDAFWDALADEWEAMDRLCRGVLLM